MLDFVARPVTSGILLSTFVILPSILLTLLLKVLFHNNALVSVLSTLVFNEEYSVFLTVSFLLHYLI